MEIEGILELEESVRCEFESGAFSTGDFGIEFFRVPAPVG
jgi:hypothetical protein